MLNLTKTLYKNAKKMTETFAGAFLIKISLKVIFKIFFKKGQIFWFK